MTPHLTSTGYERNVPNANPEMDTSGVSFSNSGLNTWRRPKFSLVRHPAAASRKCKLSFEQFSTGYALTSRERPRAKCLQSSTDTESTGKNHWQLQNPQSFPAVLAPQEAVHLVTQRAQETLHDQRETARRALLHQ